MSGIQSDSATVKEHWGITSEPTCCGTTKAECSLIFKEKLPFFWEKEIESCEVDLLFVCFHLGKVRVVGHISGQSLCHTKLNVNAGVAIHGV